MLQIQNIFLVFTISGKSNTLVPLLLKCYSMLVTVVFCFRCSLNDSLNCSPHSNDSYKFIILVFQFLSKIMFLSEQDVREMDSTLSTLGLGRTGVGQLLGTDVVMAAARCSLLRSPARTPRY